MNNYRNVEVKKDKEEKRKSRNMKNYFFFKCRNIEVQKFTNMEIQK